MTSRSTSRSSRDPLRPRGHAGRRDAPAARSSADAGTRRPRRLGAADGVRTRRVARCAGGAAGSDAGLLGRSAQHSHTAWVASVDMSLPERLTTVLTAEVAEAQRRWRTPGLSVGVARDGELAWSHHVGSAAAGAADPGHRRHPGDDRVHHQDLHRAAGDAAARRGPARPGGPARYLAAGFAARRADRPAAAQPHLGSAAGAGRPPLGDPRRPRRRASARRSRGRGAGAPAAPGVPLLEPRLRAPGPGRRAPRRPAVGGGPPRARPHAAWG